MYDRRKNTTQYVSSLAHLKSPTNERNRIRTPMTLKLIKDSKRWHLRTCSCFRSPTPANTPISYEVLNDPQSRAIYDERGMDGLTGRGGGGPTFDTADIFAQFFASEGLFFDPAGPGSRRGRGPEIISHEVTLEDLYNGKTVKMNMEREALCGQCHG